MAIILNIIFALHVLLAGFLPETSRESAHVVLNQNQWNKEILEKANTAADAPYLNQEEKDIILYTNLVRMDGAFFAEMYLQEFLDKNKLKNSKFVISLKKELKKSPKMAPLQPKQDLSDVAKGHALTSGKNGSVGHQNFQNRIKPVVSRYKSVGENCQYGYPDGLSIVLDLLIDEGVESLGHRKSILNSSFENIGVSIEAHKKYRVNSVMIYGGEAIKSVSQH
jgi:uncharacterized protein YkwD